MRKTLITIALIAGSFAAMAQTKAPAADTIHIVFNKQAAMQVLKDFNASLNILPITEGMNAKQATEAQNTLYYFIQTIYKRWPDLVPKQK